MSIRFRVAFACLLTAAVVGCPRDEFEVVQMRKDGGVDRTLTVWHADDQNTSPPAEGLLEAAVKAYGEPTRLDDGKVRFAKVFAEKLPADITYMGLSNFADFGSQRSPMGESFEYLERFPGETNMAEVARRAAKLADLWTKVAYTYFERHSPFAGDKEKLKKIGSFLHGDFRDDLLNIGLILWLHQSGEETTREDQTMIAAAAYLAERGYVEVGTTGDLGHLIENAEKGAVRKLATAIGYDPNKPLPKELTDFASEGLSDHLAECYEAIGVTEEEVQKLTEQVVGPVMGQSYVGTVIWRSDVEPVETNGDWDADKKQVAWTGNAVAGGQLPKVCFARWAFPDEAYQKMHFGKVVVREEIADYNKWYAELDDADRASLDAFLERLSPGDDLISTLQAFRFKGAEADKAGEESSPPHGIVLLLQALQSEQPSDAQPSPAPSN